MALPPVPAAGTSPRGAQLPGVGGRVLAAGVGEHVAAAARLARFGLDEALVPQLLERRVDRAGARPPESAAALADLADDLVAVHRLLSQERERRGPDITAPCAAPVHPRAVCPRAGAAEAAGYPVRESAADLAAAAAAARAAALVLAVGPALAGTAAACHFCIVAVTPPGLLVSHNKFSYLVTSGLRPGPFRAVIEVLR